MRARSQRHKKEKHKSKKEKKHKKEKRRDGAPPAVLLSEDDYFVRNAELQHWLLESRGEYFDELSSAEARKRFKKFVAKWNGGELSSKYYAGLKDAPSASATRTRHVWGFASKLSDAERFELDPTARPLISACL